MLEQLVHNGVVVPEPPPARRLVIVVRGEPVALSPKQEEMALAWARKQGTPYVEDPVFVQNFAADFSHALGLAVPLTDLAEVDFGPAIQVVQAERWARELLTAEERKALAAERKAQREAVREQYGHALVNGERVELANYLVEPSGIFMGRGEHPLRGRWKEGARHSDVTLNLSPDAPRPAGDWGEIVWQPESLWVARWPDKLSGKLKYVWLSDTAGIKQKREALKFDRAHALHAELEPVRAQIERDLADPEPRRRMIATACYLIDALCLRVGDEKDPDEADTVGATTLRPEHIRLHGNGVAEFKFLGKDSVLWHKKLDLSAAPAVRQSLEELIRNARPSNSNGDRGHPTRDKPQLFPDISSRNVNAYLAAATGVAGLTAKVFRTHHATMAVRQSLQQSGVQAGDPEHRKWEAASEANLEAAVLCNHTKKAPANWPDSRQRFQERRQKAEERVEALRQEVKAHREEAAALREAARDLSEAESASPAEQARARARAKKKLASVERQLQRTNGQLSKARLALDKIRAQAAIASKKRTWNLGTSLKSYIDPRVYHHWGRQVDYDVLEAYYPQALRRRFAWARLDEGPQGGAGGALGPEEEGQDPNQTT